MLTEIRLENFKCFKGPVVIPLKPLSVFIGPNGTGKSTPVQALLLLKQSLGNGLDPSGPYVTVRSLGSLITAVPGIQSARIGFSGTQVIEAPSSNGGETRGCLEFDYGVTFTGGGPWYHEGEFRLGDRIIKVTRGSTGDRRVEPQNLTMSDPDSDQDRTWSFIPYGTIAVPVTARIASGSSSDYLIRYEAYLQGVFQGPRKTLENVNLVPAIRGFEEGAYGIWGSRVPEYVRQEPNQRSLIVATNLGMDRDITEGKLSDWLSRITQVRVRTSIAEGPQIEVVSLTKLGNFNMVNEGLGTNQLTWLLYSLAVAPPDSSLAIEEPEIHLHPGAQAKLADIFAEVVTQEKKQLILTTHSEHILLRLLTSVAQGRLSVDDLAVNYFSKDEQGIASVTPLEIDEKGRVKGGLPGFFEADLENLDAYVKALSKRG